MNKSINQIISSLDIPLKDKNKILNALNEDKNKEKEKPINDNEYIKILKESISKIDLLEEASDIIQVIGKINEIIITIKDI